MYDRIIVATKNKGKLHAVETGLQAEAHLLGNAFTVVPVEVESGVSDSPLSDEEGIDGCANRIEAVRLIHPDAELYIALEGVIAQTRGRWYVRGWTQIDDEIKQRTARASGAAVEVPAHLVPYVDSEGQFSYMVKEKYAVTEEESRVVRKIGANGIFSSGVYTRFNSFYDGVRICLEHIHNDRNWAGS